MFDFGILSSSCSSKSSKSHVCQKQHRPKNIETRPIGYQKYTKCVKMKIRQIPFLMVSFLQTYH